jgi:hypothetical protein
MGYWIIQALILLGAIIPLALRAALWAFNALRAFVRLSPE